MRKSEKARLFAKYMTDYQLYSEVKKYIIREHFRGKKLQYLDVLYDECLNRKKKIFEFALSDAIITINSLENYMKALHVIELKRIDLMTTIEINSLLSKIGAARHQPRLTDEEMESQSWVDIIGISRDDLIICKVDGYSMQGKIDAGDTLFVDTSAEPINGNIVIAELDSNMLVKRFHKENGTVQLLSDNPIFPPININDYSTFRVYGVVKRVMKEL